MSLLLALGRTSTWHHQASAQVDVYWHLVLPGLTGRQMAEGGSWDWRLSSSAVGSEPSSAKRDMVGHTDRLCRPAGAKIVFGVWCYKYFAPLALGRGRTLAE